MVGPLTRTMSVAVRSREPHSWWRAHANLWPPRRTGPPARSRRSSPGDRARRGAGPPAPGRGRAGAAAAGHPGDARPGPGRAIPEHEADQHAEHRDVGEAGPSRPADLRHPAGRVARARTSIAGRDRTSAQEITCQAAPRRDRGRAFRVAEPAEQDGGEHQEVAGERPRAHPGRGEARHRGAADQREQPECRRGRSPPRRTPNRAVASGRRPMNTIEWAEVTCWSASAVRSGKPSTTPKATMAATRRSDRAGRALPQSPPQRRPRRAAITARAR